MVRKVNEDILEQYDKAMPEIHWRKHKKQVIDLKNDSPFAIERQLEDQKQMMDFNRNPRLEDKMKSDKGRMDRIVAKKGASRSIAMKANVVNKIVRESSGYHAYALVPPPRSKTVAEEKEEIDPDTHPVMKPYAREAIAKPIIMSFGHRPKSASRIFHPATMKIHLKHGEIAQSESSQTGFGLPVSVLSKLLNAPKLGADLFESSESASEKYDPHNLFTLPKTEVAVEDSRTFDFTDSIDGSQLGASEPRSSRRQEPSLVLKSPRRPRKLTSPKPKKSGAKTLDKDKPQWDDNFYHVHLSNADKFKEKSSALEDPEGRPILEKMTRFRTKAVPMGMLPICETRQINDRVNMAGKTIPVKVPEPVHGQPLYYDPLNSELKELIHHREKLVKQREDRIRDKLFKDALKTIPNVDYHPISKLKAMKGTQTAMDNSTISTTGSSFLRSGFTNNTLQLTSEEMSQLFENGPTLEGMHGALRAAKNGDKQALYRYFMDEDKSVTIAARSQATTKAIIAAEKNSKSKAAKDVTLSDLDGWGGSFGDYVDQDKLEALGDEKKVGVTKSGLGGTKKGTEVGAVGFGFVDDDDDYGLESGGREKTQNGFYADYEASLARGSDPDGLGERISGSQCLPTASIHLPTSVSRL